MKRDAKFRQRSKLNHGNLINRIMGNNDILPEVGKGATELLYTDRHAYEVIEVSDDYKTVKLEVLNAIADKTKQLGEGHQEWILEPTGQFKTVVWHRDAWRVKYSEIVFTKEFIAECEKKGNGMALYKQLTPEQYATIYGDDKTNRTGRPQTVVPGITRQKWSYSKINLIFGRKEYYYCWEI
jgi:hypothetical protein